MGRAKKASTQQQAAQIIEGRKLTLAELERHLWGAADLLRGSIDSEAYKHYIFGLLFYKRLCDVWEEEYEEAREELGDDEEARDPDEHRFDIPEGHFWADVRKRSEDIGQALNMAFRAIEEKNHRLEGIFQDVDFSNKKRFSDALLEKLLQHFDDYPLRRSDVEPDMLGQAYEYLIAKFADTAGKKGGEFYTPRRVVELMVECLQPDQRMTIYDPTCGSGGMLLECVSYMERVGKDPRTLMLYGQEKNLNTWAICRMNMLLHGIDDAEIKRGDTLRDPRLLVSEGSKQIRTFDMVLANPPFSQKKWGHSLWSKGDPYNRDTYGVPPSTKGDLAFVQHMIASLKPGGRMACVVPHGVLFRGSDEGKIREGIIRDDLLEAVIGLAPNLFYGAGIPAAILLIRARGSKPPTRRGKVLFINADAEYFEGRAQNYLRPEHIEKIVSAYREFEAIEGYATVVDLAELEANGFNLNIRRYADNAPPPEPQDVRAHLVGGVPRAEVEARRPLFDAHGLDINRLLVDRDEGYLDFAPQLEARGQLKELIEADPGVVAREQELTAALERWWAGQRHHITALPQTGGLMRLRATLMESFRAELEAVGLLDRFKVAGVVAIWWAEVYADLRTAVDQGFEGVLDGWLAEVKIALEAGGKEGDPLDHKLVRRLIPDYLEELSEAESGKGLSKKREKEFWEELSDAQEVLTVEDCQDLVLTILSDTLEEELQRHVTAHRQQVIASVETWWDKYRVTLRDIEAERDAAAAKLDGFLKELRYVG